MLTQTFWGVGVLISGAFLLRLAMIRLGWLKEPVLRQMRIYGAPYNTYYPLPAMLFWGGWFSFTGASLMMSIANSRFPIFLIGVVMLSAAYFSIQSPRLFIKYGEWLQPRWARELAERADYDEQRRVAWAWLRLPSGMRRRFALQDSAFDVWADLIILSVGCTHADTFVYAINYRTLKTRTASA